MELLVLPEGLRYCKRGHIAEHGKDCPECKRYHNARHNPRNADIIKQWHRDHADRRRETRERWNQRHPEVVVAGRAVTRAEACGDLIRPLMCTWCGIHPTAHAHHYLGYAPEHQLDVQYVCHKCHGYTRRKHGKINSREEWQKVFGNAA